MTAAQDLPVVARPDGGYRWPVSLVLCGAFLLSAGFTGALAAADLLPAGLAEAAAPVWTYHLVGFGTAGLALVDRRWAGWVVAAVTAGYVVLGVQLYAVLFVPGLLTAAGWFANDVHLGLLVLAEVLCVRQLRGPARDRAV